MIDPSVHPGSRATDDAATTAAMISMAKVLDLKVIAEGIENEAQLSFLPTSRAMKHRGTILAVPSLSRPSRVLEDSEADEDGEGGQSRRVTFTLTSLDLSRVYRVVMFPNGADTFPSPWLNSKRPRRLGQLVCRNPLQFCGIVALGC